MTFRFRLFPEIVLIALSSGTGYAQDAASPARPRAIMSPVPFWHDNSLQALNGRPGAFFDLPNGQLVIALPNTASASGYDQLRYGIANGADAAVVFSLQPSGVGMISYAYGLNGAPQARQQTQRFYILLPSHDSTLASPRSAWAFELENTTIPDRTATVALATMRMVGWTDPATAASKVFGLAVELQSTYLPGFANAFIEGRVANPFTAAALAGLPANIVAQVGNFLQPGIGSSTRTVIAPLFRPGADKLVIADNYSMGITELLRTGGLRQDSSYAVALLSAVNLYRENGGEGALTLPDVTPTNALDGTIQQAASLALK